MPQNQFAWWYQVQEKFSENYDSIRDPLRDLKWNEIESNWLKWIYWSFKNPDRENPDNNWTNQEELDNKENLELTSDSPFHPLLKNLKESWHITEENFLKHVDEINSLSYDESKWIILSIVSTISDSEVRSNVLNSFDSESEINEESFEKTDFYRDSQELSINMNKWVWWLELMLAKNYISIPDLEWNKDITKDISLSIDITTNSIIKNNSVDFKKQNWALIDEIRSETNLINKYKLLKDLYKNDLKHDAIHWWDKAKKEINSNKSSLIKSAETLNQKIIDAKKITNQEEREKKIEKLNLEKQKIIDEWIDIDNFEAEIQTLSWWDLDEIDERNDIWKNK